jgi:hypothetical protein
MVLFEHTICRRGLPQDWLYIDSLRKKEGKSLGFLPKAVYESVLEQARVANRDRWKYQRIIVTVDNEELTGFCMWSIFSDWVKIFQIVVQEDARKWHRAMLMLDWVEAETNDLRKDGVTCRVAYDLESNFWWKAMGYQPTELVTSTWLNQRESQSKRPIWIYKKPFRNTQLSLI